MGALLVSGVVTGSSSSEGPPSAPAEAPTTVPRSAPDVGPVHDSLETSEGLAQGLGKLSKGLQGLATHPGEGFVDVEVHTIDVPAASKLLEANGARLQVFVDGEARSVPLVGRPWGARGTMTNLHAQLPEKALLSVAASPDVLFVSTRDHASPTSFSDDLVEEERLALHSSIAQVKARTLGKQPPEVPASTRASASPTSWAIAKEHKAWDVWRLGFEGEGVNIAVVDTGVDFGHPSLQGQWATAPTGPWAGWPIMFHPASMEGLMGNGWWTAQSDLDRLPLPFWTYTNDGDSWYSNTDYKVSDTDLDGNVTYSGGTIGPGGELRYTPEGNPQGLGGCLDTSPISRTYYVGVAGEPYYISSASGIYRLGVHRDDTLTGLHCGKVGILLVDSTNASEYDTAYVDLNFDFNFTNDKPVTKGDPVAVADLTGDGIADVSGGLLYFIATSRAIAGELVLNDSAGNETSANLAFGSVAVDINGLGSFVPPTQLRLQDPGGSAYYLPGRTEDILEEFRGRPFIDQGLTFDFGTGFFGPINAITLQSVRTDLLTRGPGPDYAVDFIYSAEECDPSGVICTPLLEGDGLDYTLLADEGRIRIERDIPANWIWSFIYQLDTYTLEPVSGALSLSRPIPAGWDLLADYQTGLPIPYSQVYGVTRGYDTFIPANGDLVAFFGEFDAGQSHGTFAASAVVARPFGNLANASWDVFGTAPGAKIIGIASCCDAPGPLDQPTSLEDQRTFAALGYDGIPDTGDEAVILSNSFGDTDPLNTGFTWEDRWLVDFWTRYPKLTTIVAMGNNGPGYGTSTSGGSSPGVIGVAAGTSMDYRVLLGPSGDGGDAGWEVPVCGPPPIDPATCFGSGSPFGPGPYGDAAYFSSRGPSLLGGAKPDITSVGAFGLAAGPLNGYCCDGNFAVDLFAGTSLATPVTAGVGALIAQAYRSAHAGVTPTNEQVKELLKSGADDIHRDIFQQGAGWTNALRSVEMALDTDGISSNVDSWLPGDYQGIARIGFVNLLPEGGSDSSSFTLTNHDPVFDEDVQIRDAVYSRAARYAYSFALAPGTDQILILRPDGPYGSAGVYAADGLTRLQSMPFNALWATSDFAKVTFTYDAVAYPGLTSWRLYTFNWFDDDADPRYGGFGERNLMTLAANGVGANSVWDAVHDPDTRIRDGWVLNPQSGAASTVPATLILEFYERVDWPWVSTSPLAATINASSSLTVQIAANVQPGTRPGMYEGAIYVTDSAGDITTIPVVINVPVSSFPVALGGNPPATSLYDNGGVVQGSRTTGPFLQTGDNRYVYASVRVARNVGRHLLYQAVLTSAISDPEMFVYELQADVAWTDDARFGPGTFNLVRQTEDLLGSTKSDHTNMELMTESLVPPGPEYAAFLAFHVKAWGAIAEVDRMEANIGIMEVFPTTVNLVSNQPFGLRPVSVWANVPLYNGIDTHAGSISTNTLTLGNRGVTQDDPDNPYTSTAIYREAIAGLVEYRVDAVATADDDIDLYLFRDSPGTGLGTFGPEDLLACLACSSTTTTGVERISYSRPTNGDYYVVVHGRTVPDSPSTYDMTIIKRSLITPSKPYTDRNAPSTTIPPNTPSGFDLEWAHPPSAVPPLDSYILYVSPAYASLAFVQEVLISWVYDLDPPTVDVELDLSPKPNATIANPVAGITASIADPLQVDRFSPRLVVDGVDVTGELLIAAPFLVNPNNIPLGYVLVTVAWKNTASPWDDGPHSGILTVRDMAGNTMTQVWRWIVDTTPPVISISMPGADSLTAASSVPFEATTEPGASVTVTVRGVPATVTVSPEGRIQGTLALEEGANDIVVRAEDELSNLGVATRTVTRDSRAPVIDANADVLSPTNARFTTVSGTVDEDVGIVWVNGMSAGVAVDGSFTVTIPLNEGANPIQITTWDGAGNQGVRNLPGIKRDTIAPTIDVRLRVGTADAPTTIRDLNVRRVTVNGTVPGGDIWYVTINGESVGPGGPFSRDFDLVIGDNLFVVQAVDDAGNVATRTLSVSYAPTLFKEEVNYTSIIASGVAVVLLILGFLLGYLLSGRGGGEVAVSPKEPIESAGKRESPMEEEIQPEGIASGREDSKSEEQL